MKPVVLSIEPVEFDFVEWFGSQPALIALVHESGMPACRGKLIARLCKGTSEPTALLEACRRTLAGSGGSCGGIRKTCDAEAAAEVDMFAIADEVPEREKSTMIAEGEDEQLQKILDSTLGRIQSTIAAPRASDAEPNSDINSNVSNSPLNTKAFLDRLVRCSVADAGSGEVLKEVEFPTKKLDSGQQESVKEVNSKEAEEVVEVTPAKGYEHTSMAGDTSGGPAGNSVDSTSAILPPRKRRRRRKRVRNAHASGKLHGFAEANGGPTTSNAAEESDASSPSMDEEVENKAVSPQETPLRKHAQELSSVSLAQATDAAAVLNSSRQGVRTTEQHNASDLEGRSHQLSDAEIDGEVSMKVTEEPPYPLNSQDEPLTKAPEEALLQCHGSDKAALPADAGGPVNPPCSEVCTAESGLLRAREARKSTKSRRPRVIESSTEESCDEQEPSSVSAVPDVSTARTLQCDQHEVKMTEHDKLGDLEEMSCEHHGAKTMVKMSLTKGREKHGGHSDDSTESFSSSSGNEVASKSDGQPLHNDTTKALSSSSSADITAEGGEQSHREDAAVTQLNSDAEPICEVSSSSSKFEFHDEHPCGQGTSGSSFKKSPVALSPDEKCSRLTSTPVAKTSEDKEEHRKTTSHSPEPEVKMSKGSKVNLKSKETFEAHSDSESTSSAKLENVQHLPAMTVKAEHVPTVSTVKKTRRTRIVISSDTSDEERSVQHLALESETSEEVYHGERAAHKAGVSETLVRGLNLFSSESSDDLSAAHLTQQRAESSDEEGIVEHSAQEAKFSDDESSIEYPPLQEAKSSDERAILELSRQDTEPPDQGIVKHSAVQEGHCYETSNGVYSAPQEAESSGEEGIVEHAIAQEADLSDGEAVVGLSIQDAESSKEGGSAKLTAIGEESSNKKVRVERSALQEVESSDEEGSNGHAAQPEAGQPAVFSDFADEIPCGQQSPSASSLQNMHFSPPDSDRGGSLSPVVQETSHQAAESDADTLELQSNDELVASGRQRGAHLSQATTVSVSSQRRSPSPFTKLREMVMSFDEDSDDETDVPGFRRTVLPSSLPQSSFKVPPVKKLGTYTALTSVKSKHQNKRCSSNERSIPSKRQPARSIVCSRDAVSPRGKRRAVSDKRKVSESDSDGASAVTSDTANVSSNSHVKGSGNVALSKSKDLGLAKRKASTRNNSSRISLPAEKFTKLPESIETSESEGSSASGSDSGECHIDGNKALEPAKHNKESSSKTKKGVKVKGSPPNRRKNSPHPKPLGLDPSLPGRAALKSPSNHNLDGASVTMNKDNASSEHLRQNSASTRQLLEAESVVSTRRRSTRSSARRLAFEQENNVCKSNSGITCGKDDGDLTAQSNNIAKKPPKGKRILDDSKYANSTPEKPSAPVSHSHGHHEIAPSATSSNLTDSGIKCDASGEHPCPNSPPEKPLSSVTGQTPETIGKSTSRSGQPTSESGNGYSPSPIRGASPVYGVKQVGQANPGVLTRSARARKQLTYADGNTSPSGGTMAKSSSIGGPDVKSYGKCRNTRMTSRLPEDLEPAPVKAETSVLQDHVDSVARRGFSPTQGANAVSEGEYESGNRSIDSSSPRVTKIPDIVLRFMQNDEAEPAATVSGNENLPRTRSVAASLQGHEVKPRNTSVEVSSTSKRRLVHTKSGHNTGSSRLSSRTPFKRRRVSIDGISTMPALEATEEDVPRTNDDLRGLTQAPLLRNVNYSSDSLSSDEEGNIVRSAKQQRHSLRRLPSRRLPLHTKKEDFIIDVDEAIRSLSDTSDGDPSYSVKNEVNLEASIARLRRLKVPLHTKQERGQSGLSSATSSCNVSGTRAKRTGRLSLAAVHASQCESSMSTPSSHSPPSSQMPTTSNGITGSESPTSSLYAHQSPPRRTRSYRGVLTGVVTEKQTEEHVRSPPRSQVSTPSMSGDLETVGQTTTEMSAKGIPVLRRSTRVSVKRDTLVQHTHSNLSGIEGPAAATQMSQDLETATEERTLRSTKRNTNSEMSPSSQILAEHPAEMLDTAEEASLMDEASSTTCSTCIRCANAPSTQDSGTMTDDSYLHDEEAFSNSPMSSKRKKIPVRPASASQPKAQASKSSQRQGASTQGAATQESKAPVRRSSRISTGVLRRLSYA